MAYVPEIITPFAYATIQPVPQRDGYLVQAPIALPILSYEVNDGSDTNVQEGRYRGVNGEVWGKRVAANIAIWSDEWGTDPNPNENLQVTTVGSVPLISPEHGKNCVYFPENSESATGTVTTIDTFAKMPHASFWIHRGLPANDGWGTRIQFGAWAVVLNIGERVALTYTNGDGVETIVETCQSLGNAEAYCKNSSGLLHIQFLPDEWRKQIIVEIGNGKWIKHTVDEMPTNEQLVLSHTYGWATYEIYLAAYQTVTANLTYKLGTPNTNFTGTTFIPNGLYGQPSDSITATLDSVTDPANPTVNVTIKNDYDVNDSDGDPLGSSEPSRLVDGTLVIPSEWSHFIDGSTETYPNPDALPALWTKHVETSSILDDNNRIFYTQGNIQVSNREGQYTGSYKRRAVNLWLSNDNGANNSLICRGVTGGEEGLTLSWNGTNYMNIPFIDSVAKMQVPVGQRCVFDGWYIGSVVRFLLERGNIDWTVFTNPLDGTFPPMYAPPAFDGSTNPIAPYGPAGEDIPEGYFVLGRGTGVNPRYEFPLDMKVWDILLSLVKECSDLNGNPYYMGFDQTGKFLFAPYSAYYGFLSQGVVACFDTNPQASPFNSMKIYGLNTKPLAKIRPGITVLNNVDWMRSSLTFQGLDTLSNELIQEHREMSPEVKETLGWRSDWSERNGAWSSQEYLTYLADISEAKASLPTQVISFPCSLAPFVYVGNTIAVYDPINIASVPQLYTVLKVQHRAGTTAGSVTVDGETTIHARFLGVI